MQFTLFTFSRYSPKGWGKFCLSVTSREGCLFTSLYDSLPWPRSLFPVGIIWREGNTGSFLLPCDWVIQLLLTQSYSRIACPPSSLPIVPLLEISDSSLFLVCVRIRIICPQAMILTPTSCKKDTLQGVPSISIWIAIRSFGKRYTREIGLTEFAGTYFSMYLLVAENCTVGTENCMCSIHSTHRLPFPRVTASPNQVFYLFKINKYIFYLKKKSSQSITECVGSSNNPVIFWLALPNIPEGSLFVLTGLCSVTESHVSQRK